jgi:8-oxo-dGTP pyrophosphatase MutT (NUDIX family)
MVDVGDHWTGQTACLLQDALRLSNIAYAHRLGIAVRTVGAWHEMPHRVPNSEMQQVLTTALEKAPRQVRARFAAALASGGSSSGATDGGGSTARVPQTLTVAIAIVRDESRVLLVHRRGTADEPDSWQFPAGMVKPGLDAPTVAVRETLCETGVHCAPTGTIGSRVHPRTNVLCEYVLCEYLSGEAENRDPGENVSVTWSPTSKLTRFIPAEQIFPPVLAALEVEP